MIDYEQMSGIRKLQLKFEKFCADPTNVSEDKIFCENVMKLLGKFMDEINIEFDEYTDSQEQYFKQGGRKELEVE